MALFSSQPASLSVRPVGYLHHPHIYTPTHPPASQTPTHISSNDRSPLLHLLIPLHIPPAHMLPRLISKHINLVLGEFPRRHAALEEQIQFGEGPAPRLRDAEVGIDDAEKADACPEEAGVVAPVKVMRISSFAFHVFEWERAFWWHPLTNSIHLDSAYKASTHCRRSQRRCT